MNNEETAKPKGLVGIRSNKDHVLAWNYEYGLDIRVTADRIGPDGWGVRLKSGDEIRFIGTLLGGRGLATEICEKLRNAMTARRMKRRNQNARRAARKAALEDEHRASPIPQSPKSPNPVNPVNPV